MKKFVAIAAATMIVATGAYAQDEDSDASSDAAVQVNSSEDDEEEQEQSRQICRTEQVTGSLTRRRRICMTEAEWDIANGRTRDAVNATQRGAGGGTSHSFNECNAPGACRQSEIRLW
jgi:hypothetical protein